MKMLFVKLPFEGMRDDEDHGEVEDQLAEKILILYCNPELRKRIGSNGNFDL